MIDYNKLARVDYLERKKHFNHAPMPLDERANIFKAQGTRKNLERLKLDMLSSMKGKKEFTNMEKNRMYNM